MVGKEKRTRSYILTAVGVLIALYVLFPFFLVVLNSFKAQSSIVASPVAFKGASFGQLMTNLNAVINNSNLCDLYDLHRFDDHPFPGRHAAPDLHIQRCG